MALTRSAWLAICLACGGIGLARAADASLVISFDRAADDWERETLPIGNGAMGAAVQGGVLRDRLQFNEKTLWTGGPGSAAGYDFGIPAEPVTRELAKVQEALVREGSLPPEYVARRLGRPAAGYGNYQSFGEVVLDFHHDKAVANYRRQLDIGDAVASVRYGIGDARYLREYFASYPHQVIVLHLSSNRDGLIGFDVKLQMPRNRSATSAVSGSKITVHGKLHDNGLLYEAQLQLVVKGGEVTERADGSLRVAGADNATLILAAATGYAGVFPGYRGPDPHALVEKRIASAMEVGESALRDRHLSDYHELFDRVQFDLASSDVESSSTPGLPIDQWLSSYGNGDADADRALEALYFHYGRYLLIASSREGSLPANLQGVWNESATPPWNADYHVNINLQMNYWPAGVTNLAETAIPLFDFIDSLQRPGEKAASHLLGAPGWTLFLNTNIWGFSGVIDWPTAFWQPEAGAWLAQQYYEHYLWSGDLEFLRKRAYPVMKKAALTWMDALVTDADDTLVVSPSYSPEHGDFTAGAAMSQQIVAGLFEAVAAATKQVGDDELRQRVLPLLERLDRGLRVGSWGQLQEWKQDFDHPENQHRHVSQLFALYPGRAISAAHTPELLAAARKSLDARGDGGTGWSRAWKMNLWARLEDGNRAHTILAHQLRESTLPNLWSTHPPFQIDGNLGATAGMAEMLLQSHAGEVHLLPALPDAWADGSVKGLRARGGLAVDISWQDGRLLEASLHAARDVTAQVRAGIPHEGLSLIGEGADMPIRLKAEDALVELHLPAGTSVRISPL